MPASRTPCAPARDTGIGRFPSHEFTVNQAWLTAAVIAQALLAITPAWQRICALPDTN